MWDVYLSIKNETNASAFIFITFAKEFTHLIKYVHIMKRYNTLTKIYASYLFKNEIHCSTLSGIELISWTRAANQDSLKSEIFYFNVNFKTFLKVRNALIFVSFGYFVCYTCYITESRVMRKKYWSIKTLLLFIVLGQNAALLLPLNQS